MLQVPAQRHGQAGGTNRDYCIYHAAHGDYTFAYAWVEYLVHKIARILDSLKSEPLSSNRVGVSKRSKKHE